MADERDDHHLGLVVAGAVLALFRLRPLGLIALAPGVLGVTSTMLYELVPAELWDHGLALWFAAPKLALLAFVLDGRARSPVMLPITVGLVAWIGPLATLAFLLLALGLDFTWLAITQNWRLVRRLGLARCIVLPPQAVLYWSPMLLIIVPSVRAGNQAEQEILREIYDTSPIDDFVCDGPRDDGKLVPNYDPEEGCRTPFDRSQLWPLSQAAHADTGAVPALVTALADQGMDLAAVVREYEPDGWANALRFEALRTPSDPLPSLDQVARWVQAGWVIDESVLLAAAEERRKDASPFDGLKWAAILQGYAAKHPGDPDPDAAQAWLRVVVEDIVIDSDRLETALCLTEAPEPWTATPRDRCDFDADVDLSMERMRKTQTAQASRAVDTFIKATVKVDEQLAPLVEEVILDTTPTALFPYQPPREVYEPIGGCPHFWQITCKVKKALKNGVNQAYHDARDASIERAQAKAKEFTSELRKDAELGEVAARQLSQLLVKHAADTVADGLHRVSRWVRTTTLVLDISFYLVVVQSFLYVLARVVFERKRGIHIVLEEGEGRRQKGKLKKSGSKYTLSSRSKDVFYVARTLEPSGRPPSFSIPQPAVGVIGRVGHRLWSMNRLDLREPGGSVHFRAPGGQQFVEWTLAKDQTVVFELKNFVAMSQGIRLGRRISLQLSSMMFGRLIFTTATGPGTLVLSTLGEPVLGDGVAASASVSPSRLIAYNQDGRFYVDARLTVTDVFLSGVHLERVGKDPVVVDADQKGAPVTGVFRFFWRFISPF